MSVTTATVARPLPVAVRTGLVLAAITIAILVLRPARA